jgi:tRNA(Arg) A34 adenosine deaminase TadA
VRYMKDGTTGNAEPCVICKLAIKEAGIKLVEYSV